VDVGGMITVSFCFLPPTAVNLVGWS